MLNDMWSSTLNLGENYGSRDVGGEVLPNVKMYPDEKRKNLKKAVIDFCDRRGQFNEILFNLLYQLRELESFKMDMLVFYQISLRGIARVDLKGNKIEDPEVYESWLVEIEHFLISEKNQIFSATEMRDFNPHLLKRRFDFDNLNSLHQRVMFMILASVKDAGFSEFCATVYGMRINQFRKELMRAGDELSLSIDSIASVLQEAWYHKS